MRSGERTNSITYLNSAQLLSPGWGRLDLLDGTQFIRCIARDADVVVTFQDDLQIADIELRGIT